MPYLSAALGQMALFDQTGFAGPEHEIRMVSRSGTTRQTDNTREELDGSAPPLIADIPDGYGDTGFQSSGVIFPAEGCWEVTGKVGTTVLTFVTRVVKVRARQ